ncbi:MAG: ATP-binding protein [Cyanobacteria bacterium J06627_32]
MPPKHQPTEQRLAENSAQPTDKSLIKGHTSRFWGETRTRIFLLYTVLMVLLSGLTVPVFRYLLFRQIDLRVRADLNEEREDFTTAYEIWEAAPDQTLPELKSFISNYLVEQVPEDDNFHIVLLDRKFFRSNPFSLPAPIQSKSALFQQWKDVTTFTRGEERSDDPDIGNVLFKAEPLMLNGVQRGVYVFVHTAAGERQEVLIGVSLFLWMTVGVVTLALVLAWVGTGYLLMPLRTLSRTARTISDSDLSARIPKRQQNGELSELIDTFNAMMDRIQQAFDSQRAFTNDAGHELRTPITIIRGHLELLGEDPQERQGTVELVIDELDRMGRLVNDMILLAKSERKDFLTLETIDIESFAAALLTKARALASRNWTLKIESKGRIVGDRQRLTGALLNLLRNAAQHTQPHDTIELGCGIKPSQHGTTQQVEFWVRDTGEGISPADQSRVFARFARGQQRRSEGSGLGLSIVAAIAAAHKGKVSLVSAPGVGSTFLLTLPID